MTQTTATTPSSDNLLVVFGSTPFLLASGAIWSHHLSFGTLLLFSYPSLSSPKSFFSEAVTFILHSHQTWKKHFLWFKPCQQFKNIYKLHFKKKHLKMVVAMWSNPYLLPTDRASTTLLRLPFQFLFLLQIPRKPIYQWPTCFLFIRTFGVTSNMFPRISLKMFKKVTTMVQSSQAEPWLQRCHHHHFDFFNHTPLTPPYFF